MRGLPLVLLPAVLLPVFAGAACRSQTPAPPAETAAPVEPAPQPPDVAPLGPADAVAFFRGRMDGYPDAAPADLNDVSPSDILETFDNVLLDRLQAEQGQAAVERVYEVIARALLDTLVDLYPQGTVVLALDAGHGGDPGFEAGADGDEWRHTREAAVAVERLAAAGGYERIVVRPVFNDSVPSDFRLPADETRDITSDLLLRQARVAVLAKWAGGWNAAHPQAPVAVHEVSLHFNLNSGASLVLHQGSAARAEFAGRSVAFAKEFLARAVPALDATGLLGPPLRLFGGDGLHDDTLMWTPEYAAEDALEDHPARYAVLQGDPALERYLARVLAAWP